MIRGKKGFTFFLVAFAAILFLALLIFIWWTQIGEGGESQIVQSACGEKAQYCTTTPELELLGFLKAPLDWNGQTMNIADLIALLAGSPSEVDLTTLKPVVESVYGDGCFYMIVKDTMLKKIIKRQKLGGPKDCDSVGAYGFVTTTVYVDNNLVVDVAVGRRTWKFLMQVTVFFLFNALPIPGAGFI